MARAMDWDKANRRDRVSGPRLPKPLRPRKDSKAYFITRLQQLIKIAESDQWKAMSDPHKSQILHEIKLAISGISKKQVNFSKTTIVKKAIWLLSNSP